MPVPSLDELTRQRKLPRHTELYFKMR